MRAKLWTTTFVVAFGACECSEVPGSTGADSGDGGGVGVDDDDGDEVGRGDGGFATLPDGGGAIACVPGLETITLSPATTTVVLDGGAVAPISFTAQGQGGTNLDESALVWTVSRDDDTPPGSIEDGVLTPNPAAGGVVAVTATDGCVSGSTTVTFVVDATFGEPVDEADWQGTPDTTGPVPTIVYPSDQTRFPINLYKTLFQWRSEGATEFRLTFQGAGGRLVVYTDGLHPDCAAAQPAAGCYETDPTSWGLLASSNAGSTATWTVDALDRSTPTPTIRRGPSITIGFSKRDVDGAIFYWSTTSAGIRRGRLDAPAPEDYVAGKPGTVFDVEGEVQCVACHVVSRDGRYLAAPTKAENAEGLWVMEVTAAPTPTPLLTNIPNTTGHGFATFSPDSASLVAAWGGRLSLLDRATGAWLADIPTAAFEATHPDWSPLGDKVVFATGKGDAPDGASIAMLPFLGGTTFGDPVVHVTPDPELTDLFPMFSPDGAWVAFSRGAGGHGDADAQLFVADALATSPVDPVELVAANKVVNNETTDGLFQNSQPTWAPPGDLYWVAFNTKRAYGVVSEGGTQQIWVAAVDPALLGQGVDPSFPAFRISFQGLEENNHRAFWTADVRDHDGGVAVEVDGGTPVDSGSVLDSGMPADAGHCIAAGETCDPVGEACCGVAFCDTNDDGATYRCIYIGG